MSSKFVRFFGVTLLLGCATLFAVGQDAKTAESIEKQADDAAKKDWSELSKQGQALAKAKDLDLSEVMNLFKTRKLGPGGAVDPKTSGLGVGKVPGAIKPDGIEAKIINMSKNPMAPATLAKEQADIIRLAERTAAIASVAVHQCPVEKKMGEKDPAKWKMWMEEMHKASVDMIKAAKDKKPVDLRNATKRAYTTCTECHAVFRDDK